MKLPLCLLQKSAEHKSKMQIITPQTHTFTFTSTSTSIFTFTFRHARKYLTNSNLVDDAQMSQVERVMGLLAFPADTNIAPYQVYIYIRITNGYSSRNYTLKIVLDNVKSIHLVRIMLVKV